MGNLVKIVFWKPGRQPRLIEKDDTFERLDQAAQRVVEQAKKMRGAVQDPAPGVGGNTKRPEDAPVTPTSSTGGNGNFGAGRSLKIR